MDEELRITEISKKVVGNLDKKAKEFEEKHHFAEKAEKRIRSGLNFVSDKLKPRARTTSRTPTRRTTK